MVKKVFFSLVIVMLMIECGTAKKPSGSNKPLPPDTTSNKYAKSRN